jgi:replicative DNA helicase
MTDRLISENALIEDIEQRYFKGKVTLRELIDEQPTAYDVDKVYEQITERLLDRETFTLTDLIDILKGGDNNDK